MTEQRTPAPEGASPTETEVKLARALLAWMRLGDRGFGPPKDWECYEWRGWKLQMQGCEEYFADEFEAQACKTACVAADGLAEEVLARLRRSEGAERLDSIDTPGVRHGD